MATPVIIFPSDSYDSTLVDQFFLSERRTAEELGIATALYMPGIGYEGDFRFRVRGMLAGSSVLHRSWMFEPDAYSEFDAAIQELGSKLIVSPEQYRLTHHLPNWYPLIRDVTPRTAWIEGEPRDQETLIALLTPFEGSAVIKDYVKSQSSYWDEACFIPDVRDLKRARAVVDRFIELQDDVLEGGLVVREFVQMSDERRSFMVGGEPVSDDPRIADVESYLERIDSPFFSVDLATVADGSTIIVEVGDGGVSSPKNVDASALFWALKERLL